MYFFKAKANCISYTIPTYNGREQALHSKREQSRPSEEILEQSETAHHVGS